MAKLCGKCKEEKPASEFGPDRSRPDGLFSYCRPCARAASRAHYHRNPEQRRSLGRDYRKRNPGCSTPHVARYYAEHPDKRRESNARYFSANPGIRAKYAMDRRAAELRQTLPLTPEQRAEIASFYAAAERLSRETGISHNVDHIVPLKGKIVLGLHVPWNLQVITAEANRRKSNKLPPEAA